MNIDLNKINKNDCIEFDEKVEIDPEELSGVGIQRLENTSVRGKIFKLDDDLYNINLLIKGTMILLCDLSLEEVNYPFMIKINENIGQSDAIDEENDGKSEESVKIIENTLDIFPIVWENIILEKPSHIVKDNAKIKTSGEGWELSNNIDIKNNGLEGLKKLLDMEEER